MTTTRRLGIDASRLAQEKAEADKREASRRYVCEAAERARWLMEYDKPRPPAGSTSERTRSPSTEAECRFMSKAELDHYWGGATRGAAGAKLPQATAALSRAAYLGGLLTVAGRISEERVEQHLHRAAKAAGVGPQQAERVIGDGYYSGRSSALREVSRDGAVQGHPPGAFSAVASAEGAYEVDLEMFVEPGALNPLPVAVLVYLEHDFGPAPVAVAVPRMRDGRVEIDGVFRSDAGVGWTLARSGAFPAVSVYAHCREFYRSFDGRLVTGVLTSVDLCKAGADEAARVTVVVAAADMTPAQREVQQRFDRYLANGSPVAEDFLARAGDEGAAALEPLRPVVTPLLGNWSAPVRSAPSPSAPTLQLRSSRGECCGSARDGWTCDKPRGHDGMHFSDRPPARSDSTSVEADNRAASGSLGSKRLRVVA